MVTRAFLRVSIRHFSRLRSGVRSASVYGAFCLMAITLCPDFANYQPDSTAVQSRRREY